MNPSSFMPSPAPSGFIPAYQIGVTGRLGAMRSTVGRGRGRSFNQDVYKSLDDVVKERGITRPPKSDQKSKFGDDDDLPITGKNARILKDDDLLGGEGDDDDWISSATLDDVVIARGGVVGGGRRFNRMKPTNVQRIQSDDVTGVGVVCTGRRFSRPAPGSSGADGGTIKLRQNLDPRAASLDDLIIKGNEQGDKGFKRKSGGGEGDDAGSRMDIDNEGGGEGDFKRRRVNFVTPYRAVEYLSEKGMIILLRIGKLAEDNHDVAHLWRCEIRCGELTGMAESSRKSVSREIACQEFLKKLKQVYPNSQIPNHGIHKELFLDPKIFRKLEELGKENGLGVSNVVTGASVKDGRVTLFKCTYTVDEEEVIGTSRDMEYAKLEAAGKAYALITGEDFPKTSFFAGDNCKAEYEYTFNETEFYYKEGGEGKALEGTAAVVGELQDEEKPLVIDEGESELMAGEDF